MARVLMSRFDVFANPGRNSRNFPYLVDVQSNVISGLGTRIVVPVRPLSVLSAHALPLDLFPVVEIDGESYVLDTPQLGAIAANELKVKIGSVQSRQIDILSALDRLFGAY